MTLKNFYTTAPRIFWSVTLSSFCIGIILGVLYEKQSFGRTTSEEILTHIMGGRTEKVREERAPEHTSFDNHDTLLPFIKGAVREALEEWSKTHQSQKRQDTSGPASEDKLKPADKQSSDKTSEKASQEPFDNFDARFKEGVDAFKKKRQAFEKKFDSAFHSQVLQ